MNKITDMIIRNSTKRKESEYICAMLRLQQQKEKWIDLEGNNLEEEEYKQIAKQGYAYFLYVSQNNDQKYLTQTASFIYCYEQSFLNYMESHPLSNKENIDCIYIAFYCFGNYFQSLLLVQKMLSKVCSFKEIVHLKYIQNAIKESLNNNFNSVCKMYQNKVSFTKLFKYQTKLDFMYTKIYKSSQEYYHIWKTLSNKEVGNSIQ